MGALTDSRKRLSADHRLLPFPSSPPPPPKKHKLFSPLPPPPPPASVAPSTPATASRRRIPPPPPLLRPLHGPQRIVRAFGIGSASRAAGSRSADAQALKGGFFSAPELGLGLEQYVELVNIVQAAHERRREADSPPSQPPPPPPAATAAPVEVESSLASGAEEIIDLVSEGPKPEAAVAAAEVEMESESPPPASEFRVVVKKVPLYKDLYESAKKRDAKLRSLDFEVRLAEQNRFSFQLLKEVLQAQPEEEEVPEPFIPLTDEEEDDVSRALDGMNRREVLAVHEASNIVITRGVLQCLNEKDWLNDEVINLYLELLKERERREPKKFLKCHYFNTFFYKKLTSGNRGYEYKAVRRWTTQRKIGYGLIECDKIFIPIHKEVHWCLAVINIRDKKFQYLDSLGSMDTTVLRVLARYLVEEVKDKSGEQVDVLSWSREGVECLPLQENGWDCGMFMLKYMDFYSRDMDLCFGQKHMRYFRRRTAKEILQLRAE